MLDAFIIEEIRRREGERTVEDRPVAQLPVPEPPEPRSRDEEAPERDRGGVVIIDYTGGGGSAIWL